MDKERVRKIIRDIIEEREDFVRERGKNAISPLMGIAMKWLRGKVDGAEVSRILREEIERFLEG